jgi:nitrate/nitrite transporter NarK
MLAGVALLVPMLAVLAVFLPSNAAVGELARLFVAPPSLAAPFLGGMFAKRGGPVIGLLMGLWAALAALLLIVAIPAYQAPSTLAALLLVPVVAAVLGTVGTGIRMALDSVAGQRQQGHTVR